MVRFSVELPEEVAGALARAASELRSTPKGMLASLAQDYLAERDRSGASAEDDGFAAFVTYRHAFEAWVAEGEADVRAGRVVPAEEVFEELNVIVQATVARKVG